MLFGCYEFQKASITKAIHSFFKAREPSHSFTIKAHVREDSLLVVENTRVVAALLVAPEAI